MQATLNGFAPDWASTEIKLNVHGATLVEAEDVQGITCSDAVEVGTQRGRGGKKKARGTGQVSNEATLTLYRSGHRAMVRALMAAAPEENGAKRIGLVTFDIFYQHTPPGESTIDLVKLMGCRLIGRSFSGTEGTDLDMVEWPLDIMRLVEVIDGVEVVLL
jgi:hypothetical protein